MPNNFVERDVRKLRLRVPFAFGSGRPSRQTLGAEHDIVSPQSYRQH
ncbi:hypothetical protein SAMN05216575_108118 [Ectopseudomonas alcaliphila]|uniref:Uncharacterized protein n=1 Tax=Ectopseudomonas alcaliphila TaxID=101564 RepID=A0A1G7LHI8_9GAMM|nr:hypothetical protein SAMN05216575_108118 [Pseudomonas alcaliphila]